MAKDIFFTVCIPVYNRERELEECINTIRNQTLDDWEIVAVDDGSSDNSWDMLTHQAEVMPNRIIVLHQKNAGPYDARWRAISCARGKYVLFVDSDDGLAQCGALDMLKQTIIEASYPDVILYNATRSPDCLQSGMIDYSRIRQTKRDGLCDLHRVKEAFAEGILNTLWIKAVSLEVLNRAKPRGMGKRLFMAEDRLATAEILDVAESVFLFDETLYLYNDHPVSTMNAPYSIKRFEQVMYVERRLLSYAEEWGIDLLYIFKRVVHFTLYMLELAVFDIRDKEKRYSNYETVRKVGILDESLRRVPYRCYRLDRRFQALLLKYRKWKALDYSLVNHSVITNVARRLIAVCKKRPRLG